MLLYIDPGTGSMLFTILIGVIGAAFYSLRMLLIKLRFKLSGGKTEISDQKIPFVIFAESKRYRNIFEPICREMDKKGKDVLYITASPEDAVLTERYPHIKVECIENENKLFARLNFLNASVVLATTPGLDVYQWKRSKTVDYYIHIPHAAGEIVLYRMFGIDYYDAILLSGEYMEKDVRRLEQLRNLSAKDLQIVGIPYMDEMAVRLENAPAQEEHKRTVLLAPSWGPSALFSVYGGKIIEVLLKTGYQVIVRPHPQSFVSEKELLDKLMTQFPESENLKWNRDRDNFDVLRSADILISDFSGVIMDFALVYDKPVIYTNPNFDLAPYDAWWLDTPLWTLSALPRIGCELTNENMESLKELIDTCIDTPTFANGRKEVTAETWMNKGNGAAAVTAYLLEKYEELSHKEG